ncbi:MAG: hypothetical protein CMH78_04385 [Nitrospinae bacterium]|jgi:phosphatidylglycerophosphate synthase|nr:hypothetical protein [Nitrospinota bacterium]
MNKSSERKLTVADFEEGNEYSKEIFFKYFYCYLALPFLKAFFKTSWTPLQITNLSILLGIFAAVFFFLADFKYLVLGVVFLNLSLILDKVDGQIARMRNITHPVGGWIDATSDILLIGLYFLVLSIGNYYQSQNTVSLIIGIFCLFHTLMAFYVMESKKNIKGTKNQKELSIGNNYFGLVNGIHIYLTIGCLLDQVYWTLLMYSWVGIFTWVIPVIRIIKK